jgi:hypothetical protein
MNYPQLERTYAEKQTTHIRRRDSSNNNLFDSAIRIQRLYNAGTSNVGSMNIDGGPLGPPSMF